MDTSAAAPAATPAEESTAKPDKDLVDLLAGDFQKSWQTFSSEPVADGTLVWNLLQATPADEKVLTCSGVPRGFAYTAEQYTDFELSLEWMYPMDANGNSGVLIHTQREPRIWPTSIQVQLHQPKVGSIFPSGDAKSDSILDAAPDLARPVSMWNECRIICREGKVAVEINGRKAGEISGVTPSSGFIALQSEGSLVHFRRIRIRNLSPASAAPPAAPQ